MVMAAADHGGPDLYQLLGVARDASREEIALAWRRRARAEHPDARSADANALAGSAPWPAISSPRPGFRLRLAGCRYGGWPTPAARVG